MSCPLKIITDSKYVIKGLTTHLGTWEDRGWINIKNADLFKAAAYLLRKRAATSTFQWVKGHEGNLGNEESDRLAKQGAEKDEPDPINLEIPVEFDLQGAKLATLTQAVAYRGIRARKTKTPRQATERNLQRAKEAIAEYSGEWETSETIWKELKNTAIRLKIRQYLYKTLHETQKIGPYWRNINGYEDREDCHTCGATETMEHILRGCTNNATETIWDVTHGLAYLIFSYKV
jgi:hypothetical protein